MYRRGLHYPRNTLFSVIYVILYSSPQPPHLFIAMAQYFHEMGEYKKGKYEEKI